MTGPTTNEAAGSAGRFADPDNAPSATTNSETTTARHHHDTEMTLDPPANYPTMPEPTSPDFSRTIGANRLDAGSVPTYDHRLQQSTPAIGLGVIAPRTKSPVRSRARD